MKILYGVVGAGMGHAIRSSVVVEHLIDQGHRVHLVASSRAVDYLEKRFPEVSEIWGLSLVMENNEVKKRLTTAKNMREAIRGLPKNATKFFEVEREFDPDVAISDFESWSWAFAKLHRIPIIGLDNIQAINRCKHDESILEGAYDDFQMAKSFVKARCPRAAHYLVCTFAPMEVRKQRTTLIPPILRPRIIKAEPVEGDHLLVYQSSDSFPEIEQWLFDLDRPVRAYGVRPGLDETVEEQGVTFRPFSEQQFVRDLSHCAGVIGSAGFTLITEALHLQKPYLATPVGDQFEQLLNARYLEKLGYGMCVEQFDDVALDAFLHRIPEYREAVAEYERHDNSETFQALAHQLEHAS